MTGSASAHEYWIEPDNHMPDPAARVTAQMRVGQDYSGSTYPYLSHRFRSFSIHDADGTRPVGGMEGDNPAVRIRKIAPGLSIVAYHSVADNASFTDMDKFSAYLIEEGLSHIIDEHKAAGLPDGGFSEDYARCAKALIQAGPVGDKDQDRVTGLPAELVALNNPFQPGLKSVRVRMTWQGEPLSDWQVAVFFKPDEGSVTRSVYRTDADGVIDVQLSGAGRYLLNSVHIARTGKKKGTVWKSHWASLTFAVPPAQE